jgi:hypothetical protein
MLNSNFINVHSNIIHLVKTEVQLIGHADLAHSKMCSLLALIEELFTLVFILNY